MLPCLTQPLSATHIHTAQKSVFVCSAPGCGAVRSDVARCRPDHGRAADGGEGGAGCFARQSEIYVQGLGAREGEWCARETAMDGAGREREGRRGMLGIASISPSLPIPSSTPVICIPSPPFPPFFLALLLRPLFSTPLPSQDNLSFPRCCVFVLLPSLPFPNPMFAFIVPLRAIMLKSKMRAESFCACTTVTVSL